jgi:hypothetical protein
MPLLPSEYGNVSDQSSWEIYCTILRLITSGVIRLSSIFCASPIVNVFLTLLIYAG